MDEMTPEPAGPTQLDARRYFEAADPWKGVADKPPVCLYLEVTNRCNLLCTTCPRTYAELEPPADMSWALFTRIVDQVPGLSRAVLHGIGEPMLVKNLPKMVRYLKDRGAYVLFNTNGTVLSEKNGRALIAAGLDELRVSLDASSRDEARYLEEAEALAQSLGLTFSASGAASEPGISLARKRDDNSWSLCRWPWTVMCFTANGRALPCCIAPFSQHGYENYTLGDATQEDLREIWNGPRYQSFREGLLSDAPPQACARCGMRWSL